MSKRFLVLALASWIFLFGTASGDKDGWYKYSQFMVSNRIHQVSVNKPAKNVIIFLGDGLSIPTIGAARIYKGQKMGKPGEETVLEFEKFPHTALSKTYCVDSQVADSACSATAFLCGVKANKGTIGVDSKVVRADCEASKNKAYQTESIFTWAQSANKSTGIVTTTRVTHATPAAAYAHAADREWESDANVAAAGKYPEDCEDIASQLVRKQPGNNVKVILGGGRAKLLPRDQPGGKRLDGRNLIREWETNKLKRKEKYEYVETKTALRDAVEGSTENLLGLFSLSHMEYSLFNEDPEVPSLSEMTKSAIKLLRKDDNGFLLLVEGGRIDQAHHENLVKAALEETLEFEKAVRVAVEETDEQETLIVVTADHSHVMTFSGYGKRGSPILGIAGFSDIDNLPYPTLSYANGPGYHSSAKKGRYDVSSDILKGSATYRPITTVPRRTETHGGDDVPVYATGPQSHLFRGVMEQSLIPHLIGYAACIGPGVSFCRK